MDTDLAGAGLAANEILGGLLTDIDNLLRAGKFTKAREVVAAARTANMVQRKAFEAIQRDS